MKSPSKFLSRKALKELRENHYTGKNGVEYCPEEVDQLYFEKSTRLFALESETQLENYWEDLHQYDSDQSFSGNALQLESIPF